MEKEMPRYRCHKEVLALKIRAIAYAGGGQVDIGFEDESYAPVRVGVNWVLRFEPEPGGYFVRYKDGYMSYSPAKAFEDGYTRIK